MTDFLKEVEKKVAELLPPECQVTEVDLEGPDIVIHTKNIAKFLDDETLIKSLAGSLKKRFIIRSDSAVLMDPEKAKEEIEKIIPTEAGVKHIYFDPNFNEVIIEAHKLGVVIGRGGETLKAITKKTSWSPKLWRAPTVESPMLRGIRETVVKEGKDRKKFLKKTGKRIYRSPAKPTDWIRITGLGGWREVGRSCILLETPESKIMMDCGIDAGSFENPFPYFNSINFSLDELDAVIITHGHLDHCGFLPYLFNYGFDGPVYTSPPTRDVMVFLQEDMINVMEKQSKVPIFSEKEIKEEIKHTIIKDYGEVTDIAPDMRMTLHNAGHILGSSLVHLNIGEGAHNLMYTGDLKFGFTELFDPADTNFPRLETLLIESTYGGPNDIQKPRYLEEQKMLQIIKETTDKNGVVIIPTFAVGRAQEVGLIIESQAKRFGWDIPIYLDGMAKEASAIHTAYPEYLKKSVQRRILHNDSPFDSPIFQRVDPTKRKDIVEQGRAVILAPSGMMSGGPIVEYFKNTCENPNNTILFAGYNAEGSLGRKIQGGQKEIVMDDQGRSRVYKVNMRIESVSSLSGHADLNQLLGYFKKLHPKPEKVLTLHGEEKKCVNLARSLSYKFRVEAIAPRNLDSIRLK